MTLLQSVLLVAAAVVGTSYAWGMRGDHIGGEKGAMLPGAVLGATLALLSGFPAIAERFYVFAAVGAVSMYFGGTETYAQTMGFAYFHKESGGKAENYKKSMVGLAIKGFSWFGLCGAFLGIAFTAMAGECYKWQHIIVFIALIPLYRVIGLLVFNLPYKPDDGKMPRLYFSKGRREEYGALLAMFAAAVVFMGVFGDKFGLKLAFSGGAAGAVGWMLSHTINVYTVRFNEKKQKYFFGKWQATGRIDNWKIMEFGLGAAGALGISLCFVLNGKTLERYSALIAEKGNFVVGGISKYLLIAVFIWVLLLVVDAVRFAIPEPPKCKAELIKLRRRNVIREDEFQQMMADASDEPQPKHWQRYIKLTEICERPLYSYIPLALVLLGSLEAAAIVSVLCLYWVAIEKAFGERYPEIKRKSGAGWAIGIFGAEVISILIFTLPPQLFGLPSLLLPVLLICFPLYIFIAFWINHLRRQKLEAGYAEKSFKERMAAGATATVFAHYIFCTVVYVCLLFAGIAVTR